MDKKQQIFREQKKKKIVLYPSRLDLGPMIPSVSNFEAPNDRRVKQPRKFTDLGGSGQPFWAACSGDQTLLDALIGNLSRTT